MNDTSRVTVYSKTSTDRFINITNTRSNIPYRKSVYHTSYNKKHFLAKTFAFSSDEKSKNVRVNNSFEISLDELKAYKEKIEKIDFDSKQSYHAVLSEEEKWGKKKRLVLKLTDFGYVLKREKKEETLPEHDAIDHDIEENEDENAYIGYTLSEANVQWVEESEYDGFYMSPNEDKAFIVESLKKYIEFYDVSGSLKRKKTSGKNSGKTNEKKVKFQQEDDTGNDYKNDILNKTARILMYMQANNENDVCLTIDKYGDNIAEDLSCNKEELLALVRKYTPKCINDMYEPLLNGSL